MAKHPEKFAKEFIKEKELHKELIKEIKEKEHKDKPEKEHKDKLEKLEKEHKDIKPEKEAEVVKGAQKEIEKIQKDKDIEKVQKDKDIEKIQKDKDKDVETQPGGDPVEAFSLHKFHGKEHPEKVQKDVEKVQKDKEIETAAHAAFAQPQAGAKVIEKTHEKFIKDKEFKFEKYEKFEKREWKEFIKEFKEWDIPAGPIPIDPGGPVEQRVAALEAVVSQLMHFIPQELRPDLSTGALADEKRAQGAKPASDKPAKEAAPAEKDKSDKK